MIRKGIGEGGKLHEVKQKDVDEVIGDAFDMPAPTKKEEVVIATHECGHALVAALIPEAPRPEKVTIEGEEEMLSFYTKLDVSAMGIVRTQAELRADIAVSLGGRGSWSEAQYDRHAFTYQADVNGIDRFTIPGATYDDSTGVGIYRHRLHLFEIHDKATPNFAALIPVGRIEPPQLTADRWIERHRAFIHDDTVYYIQDELVWSAFWLSPTIVNGPF